MSVTYAGTNNYGPFGPNVAGGTSGIALTAAEPDPTALTVARTDPETLTGNTVSQNPGRSVMATQTALTPQTFDGPQAGSPAVTNVSSVNLAGNAVGSLSFVQFTGAYQSK